MSAVWRVPEAGEADSRTAVGLGGIASRIKAMAVYVYARMGAHRMRRALSRLDDYTLRDIGLSRADVGHDAGDLRGVADLLALLTDLRPR